MGLTIKSPNSSIDVSYGGFYRLRSGIASMVSAEFGETYDTLFDHPSADEEKAIVERLNCMIAEYETAHGNALDPVFEFLFASDTDGALDCAGCVTLKKLICADPQKRSRLEALLIGYAGWEHPATGADFMCLLNECVRERRALEWF